MKSNPIQLLMDEHEIIGQTEEIIHMLNQFREPSPDKYDRLVRKLIRFFKEYCDKCHHYKEEEVLFMELNDHGAFSQAEILEELLDHHQLFRDKVNKIESVLNNKDLTGVQSLLDEFINELLDHMAVENDELFVMAESVFPEREQEIIYHKFKDIDLEFGLNRKKGLEKLIDEINVELHINYV